MRELVNYRHPGPRRTWKGGPVRHLLAPSRRARMAQVAQVARFPKSFLLQNAVKIDGSGTLAPPQDEVLACPKWFLAVTCTIWLGLIFRGRGSAWNFGAHLLFFHAWGLGLGGPDRILDPQANILAWGRFGVNFGVQKNTFARK